jgi:succinoglycan biosynthesis protein ExoM
MESEAAGSRGRRVVVGVLTYRRPVDLAELLPLLDREAAAVDDDVEILVVDNDPAESGRPVVDGSDAGAVPVRYVPEPVPGITAARNRVLDECAGSDVLVFIDDDERPVPGWLSFLLGTFDRGGAAGAVGPVVSEFEVEPEPWIVAGRFFVRRSLPTGTAVDVAATNNLLLDLAVVRRLGLRFDSRFGLVGGSDTLFTRQLTSAGERLLWCQEALVTDQVPAARITRSWVLQRAFRSGNSWSLTSVELARGRSARLRTRVRLSADGLIRLAGGSARVVAGVLLRSVEQNARGRRTLARGAGLLSGAFGYVFAEYRRRPAA